MPQPPPKPVKKSKPRKMIALYDDEASEEPEPAKDVESKESVKSSKS